MKLSITTLSENAVTGPGLLAEWGLSILVETDEAAVLLDTGQSVSAAHNAAKLGIDLAGIDRIVLSHGHYDHTGGLHRILSRMKKEVEIIAHPAIWEAKYRRRTETGEERYIGMPFTRRTLENLGAKFKLTAEPVKITGSIQTIGEIPDITGFEPGEPPLCIKKGREWVHDDVPDDQALVVTTGYGLVVILGCAHRGMINTLYHARKLTGVEKIHAVLGGSHLINSSEERVWQTIAALKELQVERLGLCHCTGELVNSLLAQEFGEGFSYNHAGSRFDLLGE